MQKVLIELGQKGIERLVVFLNSAEDRSVHRREFHSWLEKHGIRSTGEGAVNVESVSSLDPSLHSRVEALFRRFSELQQADASGIYAAFAEVFPESVPGGGGSARPVESVPIPPAPAPEARESGPPKPAAAENSPASVPEPRFVPAQTVDTPLAKPPGSSTLTRVAATWQDNPAEGPWCPEAIRPHLGFELAYKDEVERDEAASPGWRIIAATRRGRMHAHRATHREDAFGFRADKDFTVVCVSDGAGSCKHSRIGSEAACRKVVEGLAAALDSQREELRALPGVELEIRMRRLIAGAVQGGCAFLEELAKKSESKPKDFRCTLLLGVLWLGGGPARAFFSQVGDGFIAGQEKAGRVQSFGKSDSGGYSGEVTCFVPDAEAVKNAESITATDASSMDAFMLCTDGIEDPFYPTEKKAAIIFRQLREGVSAPLPDFEAQRPHGPVIGAAEARERLAAWLRFEKKGENDDRTILILHRFPMELTTRPGAVTTPEQVQAATGAPQA